MAEGLVAQIKQRVAGDVAGAYGQVAPGRQLRTREGFRMLCPLHQETDASFHVRRQTGTYKCFGCGASGDFIHLVGKLRGLSDPGDAVREAARVLGIAASGGPSPRRGEAPASPDPGQAGASPDPGQAGAWPLRAIRYAICDLDGTLVAVHERTEDERGRKTFRWMREGKPGLGGRAAASLPLYNAHLLPALADGETVVVVEGEKAADALTAAGVTALGTVTGAAAVPKDAVLEPLRRFRVLLWPDHDDGGRSHMTEIAECLLTLGAEPPLIVTWPDAPAHGDAADWVAGWEGPNTGGSIAGIRPPDQGRMVAMGPRPFGPSADDLRAFLDAHTAPYDAEAHGQAVSVARMAESLRDSSWLWEGWLPEGYVTMLGGETGVGKSGVALALAGRYLGGHDWPDGTRRSEPHPHDRRVLWLETEDSHGMLNDRCHAWNVSRERLHAWGNDGMGVARLDDPDFPAALARLHRRHRYGLIVLDTLTGAHYQEENSANMKRNLQVLTQFAAREHVAVLVLHHLRKRKEGEPARVTLDRFRGSSVLGNMMRAVWALSRDEREADVLCLQVLKSNLAALPPPLSCGLGKFGPEFAPWQEVEEKLEGTATRLEQAVDALQAVLAEGQWHAQGEVKAALAAAGFGDKLFMLARDYLRPEKEKRGQTLYLRLPVAGA